MYKFKIGDRVMHERFGVGTVIKYEPKKGLFLYLVRYDRENINLGEIAKGSRTHEVYGIAVDSSSRYSWHVETSLKEVKAESGDRKPENQKPAPKFNVGDAVEVQIMPGKWHKGDVVYSGIFSGEWLYKVNIDNGKWTYRTHYGSRIRPLHTSPRVRRVVIEITDDGAEAKYIVGKTVEKSASVKRYRDDKPDDGKAAAYAVDKLFALSDARKDRELAQERVSEFAKQNSAVDNINRTLWRLFDIKD